MMHTGNRHASTLRICHGEFPPHPHFIEMTKQNHGTSRSAKTFLYIGIFSGMLLAFLKFLQYTVGNPPFSISIAVGFAASMMAAASILASRKTKVNLVLLLFLVICAASIIVARPLPSFQSWERLILLSVSLMAISPLLTSPAFNATRNMAWWAMMMMSRVTVGASFIIYLILLLGVEEFPSGHTLYPFYGSTIEYMILSPIAAMVALDSLWRAIKTPGKTASLSWLAGTVISCLICALTGSRITLAGLAIGIVVIAWFSRKELKQRLARHAAAVMICLAVAVSAAFIARNHIFHMVIFKMELAESNGSVTSSRDGKWADRIQEFKDEPILGIGYAAQKYYRSQFDDPQRYGKPGPIEPGSSWLSVIAQTGALGGLCMLAFICCVILTAMRNLRDPALRTENTLFFAILSMTMVNGIAEGWLLFAGGGVFMPFWFSCGMIAGKSPNRLMELMPKKRFNLSMELANGHATQTNEKS